MCQQIMQFCTGSTKPLLFAGGCLSLLLAVAIGYTGCTTHALYTDIDPAIGSAKSLAYFLQLAAAGYLTLITIFSCYAAYHDHKHSIRALAFITTLNFILALVAIMMVPSGQEVGRLFEATLKEAAKKYDFADKGAVDLNLGLDAKLKQSVDKITGVGAADGEPAVANSTAAARVARGAAEADQAKAAAGEPPVVVRELNATIATKLWDRLQARGCCGMVNGTDEWKSKVPKSCCSLPVELNNEKLCKEIDTDHQQGCLMLIGSTSLNLLIVLALIALVNFYLAMITGISAYRTFHYDEASQSAYS